MSSNRIKSVAVVELIAGYQCNGTCVFCTATRDQRRISMTTVEALSKLDAAQKKYKPGKVRFGGGEPTIRRDLPPLVRFARSNGADKATVQTNGFRFFYKEFVKRLIESGLTGANFSIRTDDASIYSSLTGVAEGCRWAWEGVENAAREGLSIEIDILLVKPVLPALLGMTRRLLDFGVMKVNYWFPSVEGGALGRAELIPSISESGEVLKTVFAAFPDARLRAFYMPHCALIGFEDHIWHPVTESTLVVTPGDEFMLEKGRVDIGVKAEECRDCLAGESCFGVRDNYLKMFGSTGIAAIR